MLKYLIFLGFWGFISLISVYAGIILPKVINAKPLSEDRFQSVVKLKISDSFICTGVFVSANRLLTAAHCLDELHSSDASQIMIQSKWGKNARAISFYIHPQYVSHDSYIATPYDIAIVLFDYGVAREYKRLSTRPGRVRKAVLLIGYGKTDLRFHNAGQKHFGYTVVTRRHRGLLYARGNSEVGAVEFDDFYSLSAGGDSGGPAMEFVIGSNNHNRMVALVVGHTWNRDRSIWQTILVDLHYAPIKDWLQSYGINSYDE